MPAYASYDGATVDLWEYPGSGTLRLHRVATSPVTVGFTYTNLHPTEDIGTPGGSDDALGWTVPPLRLAPGETGTVWVTYRPTASGAPSSAAPAGVYFLDWDPPPETGPWTVTGGKLLSEAVWFVPTGGRFGTGSTPDPAFPAWATPHYNGPLFGAFAGALGGWALMETSDAGDGTFTVAPFAVPELESGTAAPHVESISVTNGAGGWSVSGTVAVETMPGGADLWSPVVTYTPPGGDPGPASWTWVDVTIRDDMGPIVALDPARDWPWYFISQDSFAAAGATRSTGTIDASLYPYSVARLTMRIVAYHGAVPTLPAAGGWTRGRQMRAGVGWHLAD